MERVIDLAFAIALKGFLCHFSFIMMDTAEDFPTSGTGGMEFSSDSSHEDETDNAMKDEEPDDAPLVTSYPPELFELDGAGTWRMRLELPEFEVYRKCITAFTMEQLAIPYHAGKSFSHYYHVEWGQVDTPVPNSPVLALVMCRFQRNPVVLSGGFLCKMLRSVQVLVVEQRNNAVDAIAKNAVDQKSLAEAHTVSSRLNLHIDAIEKSRQLELATVVAWWVKASRSVTSNPIVSRIQADGSILNYNEATDRSSLDKILHDWLELSYMHVLKRCQIEERTVMAMLNLRGSHDDMFVMPSMSMIDCACMGIQLPEKERKALIDSVNLCTKEAVNQHARQCKERKYGYIEPETTISPENPNQPTLKCIRYVYLRQQFERSASQ